MHNWLASSISPDVPANSYRMELVGEFCHGSDPDAVDTAVRLAGASPNSAWLVDACGLTFADSSFISFLLRLRHRLGEHGSLDVHANRTVARIITLVGIDDLVGLVVDADDTDRPDGAKIIHLDGEPLRPSVA